MVMIVALIIPVMKCPICTNTNLITSDRTGVEIEYCPQCRGVWLNRDEWDKIIAQLASGKNDETLQEQRNAEIQQSDEFDPEDAYNHGSSDFYSRGFKNKKKKKDTNLGDVFIENQ